MTTMDLPGKRILLCDCEASMPLDAGTLAKACRAAGAEGEIELNTPLCRAPPGHFQQAILGATPALVPCTPEAPPVTDVLTIQGADDVKPRKPVRLRRVGPLLDVFTIMVGHPKVGQGMVLMDWIARVPTGRPFFGE